jgi:hypothetical protein
MRVWMVVQLVLLLIATCELDAWNSAPVLLGRRMPLHSTYSQGHLRAVCMDGAPSRRSGAIGCCMQGATPGRQRRPAAEVAQ